MHSQIGLPSEAAFHFVHLTDSEDQETVLLDTLLNARELLGDPTLGTAKATPIVDLAHHLDRDGDGQLDDGAKLPRGRSAVTRNEHPRSHSGGRRGGPTDSFPESQRQVTAERISRMRRKPSSSSR